VHRAWDGLVMDVASVLDYGIVSVDSSKVTLSAPTSITSFETESSVSVSIVANWPSS
jgi:hypothetical protein